MEIVFQFTKKRSTFGRQPLFQEQGPEMVDNILPDKELQKCYMMRNPIHQMVQNTNSFAEKYINTYRSLMIPMGINHTEGGWSKDININDIEQTQRYRRRVEKDEAYVRSVINIAPKMEHYIKQNNAINMYRSYFSEMNTMPKEESHDVRSINVYKDPHNRYISSIAWIPEGGHRFTVTYSNIDFYLETDTTTDCYQWNVERPDQPEFTIKPPYPMLDLKYNNREPTIMAGALSNGQVAAFDTRVGSKEVALTAPHASHRGLVRNVIFIYSKSGKELFSGSVDGTCKWWDLRKLDYFTDVCIMDLVQRATDTPSMATAFGVSVLEYEPSIPTRFIVGTENGYVLGGNRKGRSPLEKIPLSFNAHLGPVVSLQRNPHFLKIFVTVGDWTAKIWSDECRESPVMWTPYHAHNVTAATWSPSRISLLVLTGADGKVALWDFLRKYHEPVFTMKISDDPLLCPTFHEGGSMVAVGTSKGEITLLECSQGFTVSNKQDKVLFNQILDRETRRERLLEARMREIKLKQRKAEEGTPQVSEADLESSMVGDRDLIEATNEYMAVVKKENSSQRP